MDLRRDLPRADHPPPRGRADRGHLPPRAASGGRRAQRPPARRAQSQRVRRPARRADEVPPAVLLLPDPARPLDPAVGQRPADLPRRPQDLCLRPGRGRPARTGRLPVVPRPPPRPHRGERLAGAGRDVDRRRRARPLPAAAPRRVRHPADDRRPRLRPPQPAGQPVPGPAPAVRRRLRRPHPGQRGSHAPSRGRSPAPPPARSSMPPTSAPTTSSSPTAPRSPRSPPRAA